MKRALLFLICMFLAGCNLDGILGSNPVASRRPGEGVPGQINLVACFGGPTDSLAAIIVGLPWCGR